MFQHVQVMPLSEAIEASTIIRTKTISTKKAEFGRDVVALISFGVKTSVGNPADYTGPLSGSSITDEEHEAGVELYAALHEFAGVEAPVRNGVGKDGKIFQMIVKFIMDNWSAFYPYIITV